MVNNKEQLLELIKESRAQGNDPRVHGNRFLQFDLPGNRRLHVFGDERLPGRGNSCQSVPTTIHDHIYSFVSQILCGELCNKTYDVVPGTTYHRCYGIPNMNILHKSGNETYDVVSTGTYFMKAGSQYFFKSRHYHESLAFEPTLTLMMKTENLDGEMPNVLCPINADPDNKFSRWGHDITMLYSVMQDALDRIDSSINFL